ncbi:hypothetical protein DFH09DRAFT_1187842 [Mycena vulgaris]|nr:hypothetical protein DFH09DRAFT_1187842 [Mycena vulgaris]
MSISLFKPIGRYQDLKWRVCADLPRNMTPSLVSAVLPDDLVIWIVEDAARDTTTALSLSLVSKAVGRMAESVLYNSITLSSITATRTFTTTLRTKSRLLLSGVKALALGLLAPRDFEDFWVLVGQRCPHIDKLSLFADDLASPRHLTLSFKNTRAPPESLLPTYDFSVEPSPRPWDRVTHLSFHQDPSLLRPLIAAQCLQQLTHVACVPMNVLIDQELLHPLLLLPRLRVCIVWAEKTDPDDPKWEVAESEARVKA